MRYPSLKHLVDSGATLRLGDLVSGALVVEPVVAMASDAQFAFVRGDTADESMRYPDATVIEDGGVVLGALFLGREAMEHEDMLTARIPEYSLGASARRDLRKDMLPAADES